MNALIGHEAVCKHCDTPIYLPPDRVCFVAVADDGAHCPAGRFGWHEPAEGVVDASALARRD